MRRCVKQEAKKHLQRRDHQAAREKLFFFLQLHLISSSSSLPPPPPPHNTRAFALALALELELVSPALGRIVAAKKFYCDISAALGGQVERRRRRRRDSRLHNGDGRRIKDERRGGATQLKILFALSGGQRAAFNQHLFCAQNK